jgi:hypothetical protein
VSEPAPAAADAPAADSGTPAEAPADTGAEAPADTGAEAPADAGAEAPAADTPARRKRRSASGERKETFSAIVSVVDPFEFQWRNANQFSSTVAPTTSKLYDTCLHIAFLNAYIYCF